MIYEIKKGCHRAGWFFRLTRKNKLIGKIKFIGDVSYQIDLQKDTNKIIGLSDGWNHHKHSCRLGWRWNLIEGRIEIMTISYKNKVRFINHLCFCDSDIDYDFEIIINKGYYVYRFGDNISIVPRLSKWLGLRYICAPFFGGTNFAPKDIKIGINLD